MRNLEGRRTVGAMAGGLGRRRYVVSGTTTVTAQRDGVAGAFLTSSGRLKGLS